MSVLRVTRESVILVEWDRNEISVLVRRGIQGAPPTVNGIPLLPCARHTMSINLGIGGAEGWVVIKAFQEMGRRTARHVPPPF